MKISAYIASLTANGMPEDAARALAKGQATALSLVDDIGLTMPLASGLVKGLVAGGLDEESATDAARVAITKGKAVDDLAAKVTEPATVEDAVTQLQAVSEALAKGGAYKAGKQAEMELEEEDDDDEDGDDGDDDGKPDGLDGDDRGKPDTMPARRGAKKGLDVQQFASIMTDALSKVSEGFEAQIGALNAKLEGIAKGLGAQGLAQVEVLKTFNKQSESLQQLAKGINAPRGPRSVQDVEPQKHPSEVEAAKGGINRANLATQALVKGATSTDPKEREALMQLSSLINSTASDADVLAAANPLGLA